MLDQLRNLPRDGRDTLFMLAVIGLVVTPQIDALPVWCSVLCATVLVWRGVLAWQAKPLPPKPWLVGLTIVTVGATWMSHSTVLGKEAGVTLVVALLALKTLELRARRDAYVVFFLGFFTMMTSFLSSQSLLMALAILLGLLGLLTALVNAHMPVGKPPLMQSGKIALGMTLLGSPIVVVLFLLFPRMAPLWGLPNDAYVGRTGLSANMQVGQIGQLALDSSVAMSIRFRAKPPPQYLLYFRGPVLSYFDGSTWQIPPSHLYAQRQLPPAKLAVQGEPVSYQVTLMHTMKPWLTLLDATQEAPKIEGMSLSMGSDLHWQSSQTIVEMQRFDVQSYLQFTHGPTEFDNTLRVDLQLPTGFNPRTKELAAELRADPNLAQADTLTLVNAVMQRLRRGGYTYTLEPGVTSKDSADDFWFVSKQGFCEHLASAFVILMRNMGVPARVVTGYQGGELNRLDGFWVVRESDAHAWAEVWQAGVGWIRVDPTQAVAPGRIGAHDRLQAPSGVVGSAFNSVISTVSPGALVRMREAWEALNNGWSQVVLDYGRTRQLNLLKKVGFSSPSWEDLVMILASLMIAFGLIAAVWAAWERRHVDPWLRLLYQAQGKLRKLGWNVPDTLPPRSMAELITQRCHHTDTTPLRRWLLQLENQRYATQDRSQARQTLLQLRREFRQLVWPTP